MSEPPEQQQLRNEGKSMVPTLNNTTSMGSDNKRSTIKLHEIGKRNTQQVTFEEPKQAATEAPGALQGTLRSQVPSKMQRGSETTQQIGSKTNRAMNSFL